MVGIEGDLLDIVAQIKDFSPDLSVRWSTAGEYFAVYERVNGKDELVFTTTELDQRVVERLRLIASSSYDYVKDITQIDKNRDAEIDHKHHEEVGERGEVLAHALRKDLQAKNRIIVPYGPR